MAEEKFKIKVVTPEGIKLYDIVEFVSFNSETGEVGVLASHTSLGTKLKPGRLLLKKGDSDSISYFVASGYAHIRDHELSILTPYIESCEDIDMPRAEEAKVRAEKRLKSDESNVDRGRALLAMLRAQERLFVKAQQS